MKVGNCDPIDKNGKNESSREKSAFLDLFISSGQIVYYIRMRSGQVFVSLKGHDNRVCVD